MRGECTYRGATRAIVAALLLALIAAVPALAQRSFPGGDPSESPRANTPNDPEFDRCEPDDEDTPQRECTSYFNEQFGLFGFSPDTARTGLLGLGPKTQYVDCSQLDAQGREANRDHGDPECSQLSGVRADTAWKYSTGSPDVAVAILDTGIEWQNEELVDKVRLNTAELPKPQGAATYDKNGDGWVSVSDYAADLRVSKTAGDTESDKILDGSDLIATFSDKTDADRNGYVDDIAGWDFFDDDNDPFDASSCCSAEGHGTDRAREAVGETNNGEDEAGVCPRCQVMPIRVWDTFVVDSNLYSLGVVYAADNGASVVEGAVGGLLNSQFARRAFSYADSKGVTLTLVSSDINSANHNYPTNYNEAIYVGGSLPDSAPGENCETPSFPGVGGGMSSSQCRAFLDLLGQASGGAVTPSSQPPTTSFFRNANLTQYGGKADIVLVGSTGSANTGQASGAAGLIQSFGRQRFGGQSRFPKTLSGNEIRQLLTMSAEDPQPENTGQIGLPDRANDGWDSHFGYGRVNLAGAMAMVQAGRIPPEAQIDAPDWFAPVNVGRVGAGGLPIEGRVAAPHSASGVGAWQIDYACGQDARDADFQPLPGAGGTGARTGELGRLSKALLTDLARTCDGSVTNDAGRPAGRPSNTFPSDPYPDPDPERHAFQIRLTVHEAGDPENIGRYRKTLHAYGDDGNLPGWPKPIGTGSRADRLVTGSGGETPPRLADLDGDNTLDVVLGTSSGELYALDARGRPLESFNGGRPVQTQLYSQAKSHDRPSEGATGEPREPLRAPAIGDVTGDGEPELVVTAGERVYAWHRDGKVVAGFPKRLVPALSAPCKPAVVKPCFDAEQRQITRKNHIKRGFLGSPALADLDGNGRLDIVAGALDAHVYAWNGRGRLMPGFPAKLSTEGANAGAEIATSPAIADLDGDDDPEIVTATNEVLGGEGQPPDTPDGLADALVQASTGSNVVYALHGDGKRVAGWPVRLGTLAGDILPLVVPGHDAAAFDQDGDGDDEVALSAATADARLVDGDGRAIRFFSNEGTASPNITDASSQLNLADYPSIGDLGTGSPSVIKGGISLNGVVNLLAVNQNLPFNHSVQAWNPATGTYLPGFPTATDDFQLVSQPAVAKVDGAGGGRQALVGTGLYQLHAYGQDGTEPAGWPKFTGGWTQPTPSAGDIDGDGKLDVIAVTREGFSFVWRTDAPACQTGETTTNQEWWTSHHDEFGTANYGTDARPPSRPGKVAARRSGPNAALSFAGSGDDLLCGRATRYEVRGSDRPITTGAEFARAERLAASGAVDAQAGQTQRLTATGGARFRFLSVRAVDDAGNVSLVSPAQAGGGGGGSGVRIRGVPRRCVSRSFTARVTVPAGSPVAVRVDGRRVRTVGSGTTRVRIATRRLRPGRHVLSVGTARSTFVRCARRRPRFTG